MLLPFSMLYTILPDDSTQYVHSTNHDLTTSIMTNDPIIGIVMVCLMIQEEKTVIANLH